MTTKLTMKERMAIERVKMPEADGTIRSRNFEEVNLDAKDNFSSNISFGNENFILIYSSIRTCV